MKLIAIIAILTLVACSKGATTQHTVGASRSASRPSSWAVPAWFFDPANTSGCASDANTCQSAACGDAGNVGPCIHYYEVVSRWGTTGPTLEQTTTLTWLSSQPDATDPVAWYPKIDNGASAIITSSLTTVATGTLASVVAKNRTGGQLLQAQLPAGATNKTMILNATHPSVAWPYTLVSGTTWTITQPLLAITVPLVSISPPAEVDTWANGDQVTMVSLQSVNIVDVEPTLIGYQTPNFANGAVVYRASVLSPLGDSRDLLYLGDHSSIAEAVTQRFIQDRASATIDTRQVENVANVAGIEMGEVTGSGVAISAGYTSSAAAAASAIQGSELKRDTIVGSAMVVQQGGIGAAYLAVSINAWTSLFVGHESVPVWGPGVINMLGTGKIYYGTSVGGISTAVGTFANGGLTINSSATACSVNGSTVNCGISITPANLDATAGASGFGGRAFLFGGGSIVNGPP